MYAMSQRQVAGIALPRQQLLKASNVYLQTIHDEQENFISDLLIYNILFTADFDTKVIPT